MGRFGCVVRIGANHRGASGCFRKAPENTLAAFNQAWDQRADGIEGDFRLTRDGEIVCLHDADSKRTGGRRLVVSQSTLAELRTLEYGGWKGDAFQGELLPTFAQVLASVPEGKTFVIELKSGPEIVPVLKRQLERARRIGAVKAIRLLIIAFDPRTVATCKTCLPDIRVHWLTDFDRDKTTGDIHPTVNEIVATLKSCSADGIGFRGDRSVLTEEFIDALRQQGMKEFHVWTIDRPEDARYFRRLGASGITTNRPAAIRRSFESHEDRSNQ